MTRQGKGGQDGMTVTVQVFPVLALLDRFLEVSAAVQLSNGRVKISQPMLITTGVRVPHTALCNLLLPLYTCRLSSPVCHPLSSTLARYFSLLCLPKSLLVAIRRLHAGGAAFRLGRGGPHFPARPPVVGIYASRPRAYQAGPSTGSP